MQLSSGRRCSVCAIVLLLALAVGVPAGAQPLGGASGLLPPPVTINSCGPILDKSSPQTFAGFPIASTSSGIQIEFVNDAPKTADLVNFAVDANGDEYIIRDVGTFSPNVSIRHQYRNGAGQAYVLPAFIAPNITCHVASVKFTDGSVWRRGMMVQPAGSTMPAAAPLAASPARLEIDGAADSELFLVTSANRVAAFRENDNCAGIATVFVAATGGSSATYSVRPIAPGTCSARIIDDAGNAIVVPITIR